MGEFFFLKGVFCYLVVIQLFCGTKGSWRFNVDQAFAAILKMQKKICTIVMSLNNYDSKVVVCCYSI